MWHNLFLKSQVRKKINKLIGNSTNTILLKIALPKNKEFLNLKYAYTIFK